MKPIKIDEFYKYSFLSNLTYSPSGKEAIVVKREVDVENNGYKSFLYLYRNNRFIKLTNGGKEAQYVWKSDEEVLLFTAREKTELKRIEDGETCTPIYSINVNGGEAVKIAELPIAVEAVKRIDKDTFIVFSSIDVNYPDYYKQSASKRAEINKQIKEDADYEVCDEMTIWMNGAGFINKKRTALFIYNLKKNKLTRISDKLMEVAAVTYAKGKVYYAGEITDSKINFECGLYEYDLAAEKNKVLIKQKKNFNIYKLEMLEDKLLIEVCESKKYGLNEGSVIYSYKNGKVEPFFMGDITINGSVGTDCALGGGTEFKVSGDKLYYVETRRNAAILSSIDKNGKQKDLYTEEGAVKFFDVNADGEILVCYMGSNSLEEIYTLKNGELKKLSKFNDAVLKDKYVAVPHKMTIKSAGMDIDGWVLEPIGYDKKKTYPCVLDIHGGPKTVYGEVFYHEMQVWASMGYFVCFCNPFGSDGRGNKFMDVRGKYGSVDYQNIMDFMDAVLKKYPAINKKKVCVTGGSYGGFMTNWIVGHTDRFVCAATQRSISNWISFEGVSDIGPYFTDDQQAGNRKTAFNKIWDHSPLKYVDNVKTPLLFIHSDQDYRCPLEQGLQFYTAIKNNGGEARLVIFHGENHELSRGGKPKHRLRRLTEITNWFEKYTK